MSDDFDARLDRCLDRLQTGEDIESILRDYQRDEDKLRSLLKTALQAKQAYAFTPSADAKTAFKRKLDAALVARREQRRTSRSWFLKPIAWGVVAAIAVALLVVYIGVRPVFSPGAPQISSIVPVPSPTGNFSFLLSDEVNAISEFDDVTVGINRIGIQQSSDGKWIEVRPSVTSVDLTEVPGDLVQEIWRGDLPAGDYSQVFIYVDNVTGALKATGQSTEIKLPSQKLHLSLSFSVSENTTTSFTYDLTVLRTGNSKNAKYMLKPQLSESGVRHPANGNGESPAQPDKTKQPNARPTDLPTPTRKPPKK